MNLIEITIVSVGKNPLEEMEQSHSQKKSANCRYWVQCPQGQNDLGSFPGKAFSITVIQVYAPNTDAKEARVQWCYEDVHHSLELTSPKNVLFIIGDWNGNVGSKGITCS